MDQISEETLRNWLMENYSDFDPKRSAFLVALEKLRELRDRHESSAQRDYLERVLSATICH